ncbi:ligase-associated DNA damage response DEXH box helicase [Stappia indica]|uniref:ligase-associated DNA damage response DEXH box helicase n=1 Tax=Stappia indica TaxID=538381 RepID=UPI0008319B8E|nr:ligase-associated DNA damage response DEXH box helicase [Stappia indica]
MDAAAPPLLPERFSRWFESRGWSPRAHQLELLETARSRRSVLLIAPTGAGKTLAGFLPSLVALSERPRRKPGSAGSRRGVHTLYVSPLKALAVDIARNLEAPVAGIGLDIRIETRTGDTPAHKRQRQKQVPPDILLTTPEQIALLLSDAQGREMLADVDTVILDELHALVTSKRGDLLALGLAALRRIAPSLRTIGLSATVAEPDELRAWLVPQSEDAPRALADVVTVAGGAEPDITILDSDERLPWSGHSARHAVPDIYRIISQHRTSLVFVNTRSQAEMLFQALWHANEDNLPIALHHGSLDVGQRRKVEAAMASGALRAIVCTSSLDLGIDWGDVDLVINVGAPKGASRLAQRIGRANHRMDEPSRAILVPANRFEVLECKAALDASRAGRQDTPPLRKGALDVLAQHVLGCACAGPFDPLELFDEIRSAESYRELTWERFEQVIDFVATGGYALRTYDRYARLKRQPDGRFRLSHPKIAQQYRLNVGTIVEAPMLKVRLVRSKSEGRRTPIGRGGRMLGEMEEWFVEQLALGDTFLFAGEILRFEGLRENEAYVSRARAEAPKVPSYQGGKFPLSTYLAAGVRAMLADPASWQALPHQVREWLEIQKLRSALPQPDGLLVETFPRSDKHYLVCYPFEGRLAHQTLGMLLTRRLERLGAHPMGFVANDYALAVWGLGDLDALIARGQLSLDELFDEDMLGDDLDAWLAESSLMKRTFRTCAVIAGLIERRFPGQEKNGRQVTVSADLIYDVLRRHEPDHILLQATFADAATGLLDISRLGELLARIRGRIAHTSLARVSPLAVPVMLEIGKEPVFGEAQEALLAGAAGDLVKEAME